MTSAPGRTRLGPGSEIGRGWAARRAVVACALGAWAPAAAVWPPAYRDRTAAAALVVLAGLTALALELASRWWTALLVGGAAAAVVGVVLVQPRVGGAPVVAAGALVGAAHAALVRWPPVGDRRWDAPAWLALPVAVGATVVWWATISLVATVPLVLATLGAAELSRRRPLVARRVDGALRSGAALVQRWTVEPAGVAAAVRHLRAGAAGLRGRRLARRDGWFLAALGVGLVLRAVWAIAMTDPQEDFYSSWNLLYARAFAAGDMPSYAGRHTAYWPPGYGMALAPLQWLADRTGWYGSAAAAAAFNVVAGTATVALAGLVAGRWFGPAARNPAAWLMAVAAGHVYASSAAAPETLATTWFLVVVLAATVVVDRGPGRSLPPYVAVGLAVGAATLTKDAGMALVLVPAACARARWRTWRGALRPTLATLAGLLLVLVPWAVRNGVQVGVWSPGATVVGEGLCFTRLEVDALRYEIEGPSSTFTPELLEDCYRDSPFDDPDAPNPYADQVDFDFGTPDEARWNRRQVRLFATWAATHPLTLLEVAPVRVYTTAGNDVQGGLVLASHSGEIEIAGPLAAQVYQDAASAWYYAVAALALLALARLRRVRAALPLWAIPAFAIVYTIPGPRSLSRHLFVGYPFLAVMAAAALVALAAGARAGEHAGGAP